MGKKILITEEEKSKILGLYKESYKGPEESEFVVYSNPFKNKEYSSALREYSPNLRDGDLFIETKRIRKDSDCFKSVLPNSEEIQKKFVGKTFRNNDQVRTIKNIEVDYHNSPGCRGCGSDIFISLTDENYQFPVKFKIITTEGYDYESVYLSENVKQNILKEIPKVSMKDLPDCFFKIMRIKRVETDFKP